jgi:hypothetical protein
MNRSLDNCQTKSPQISTIAILSTKFAGADPTTSNLKLLTTPALY